MMNQLCFETTERNNQSVLWPDVAMYWAISKKRDKKQEWMYFTHESHDNHSYKLGIAHDTSNDSAEVCFDVPWTNGSGIIDGPVAYLE
ncbi:MAG: hypothetical protein CHKLHMKO_00453 [Candidatus Argoarchaeum ethanivorans]|uniref:Uncharacterized protein n=1 Tax=Candidatus Argoarchaeum ethanivorans TaxID=2608793 RepID=A0A811TEV5_9EURY|nr:MAG: hypothetical protein CHKLHMKO_00453 [Candidatus Argoarchaeum ethanivorans]